MHTCNIIPKLRSPLEHYSPQADLTDRCLSGPGIFLAWPYPAHPMCIGPSVAAAPAPLSLTAKGKLLRFVFQEKLVMFYKTDMNTCVLLF